GYGGEDLVDMEVKEVVGNPGKISVNNNTDSVSNSGANEWKNTNVQGMKSSENFDARHSLANSGNNKLKYVPVIVNEIGNKVVDMDPVVEEGSKKWGLTLVGYFVGYKMSHKEILGHLRRMWRPFQLESVIMNDGGLYFFNFSSEEGLMNVIEKGSWLRSLIFLLRLRMLKRKYGRANYARVLIEVDADNSLIEPIEIYYKSLGKSMMLDVEYASRPPSCSHCKVFGHCFENYKIRTRT
ncbi:RNA-directed DNA polymerase, eukaryota, reverse transcriptase zinc-binding domain protein, partial [Tanacetum coccineum]